MLADDDPTLDAEVLHRRLQKRAQRAAHAAEKERQACSKVYHALQEGGYAVGAPFKTATIGIQPTHPSQISQMRTTANTSNVSHANWRLTAAFQTPGSQPLMSAAQPTAFVSLPHAAVQVINGLNDSYVGGSTDTDGSTSTCSPADRDEEETMTYDSLERVAATSLLGMLNAGIAMS